MRAVRSQKAYDEWLNKLVGNFRRYWKRAMGREIDFGPSYKLPNLLMKTVLCRLPTRESERLLEYLHVPLDRYTLIGLCDIAVLPGGRRIPRNATMGFVDDLEVYEYLQQLIGALALKARVSRIAYDYLAWDSAHY